MKLTKAIEILELAIKSPGEVNPLDYIKAQDLSIEGLKWRREVELEDPDTELEPLPGEDPE